MTEKLVVPIEVTVARLERDLAKIANASVATAKKVEKDFVTANDNVGKSFQRAAGAGKQQMDVISRSLKGSGFAVSNLSAQLNDIGVSLAGGQSPFQVMIQQGTQVSQIVQQNGGSFKSFASLLGSAVAGIINPVSIATFAIIGLTGAAIQWATSTGDAAEEAKKALDDHIKDVNRVVDAWGETVPALKEYLDELEKARDKEAAKEVLTQVIAEGWANVSAAVKVAESDVNTLLRVMEQMGQGDAAKQLGDAFAELQKKIADNTATADDANAVAAMAAAFARETSVPAFQTLASVFEALAIQIGSASDQTAGFRKELEMTQDAAARIAALREKALDTLRGGRVMVEQTDDLDARMGIDPLKPKVKKARSGRSRATPVERYEDRAEAKQLEIDKINAEREALEKLNPFVEDYGRAIDFAQTKSYLLAEAKKKDIELSPQQLAAVEALANAHADATAQLNKLKDAQAQAVEQAKEFTGLSKTVLSGFISDLRAGVSATEALGNALDKIADKLIDIALNSFFEGAGGNGLTSFFGSLFKPTGFAKGGYTGDGGRNEPAGTVHRGEYVFDADATRRIGVNNLASLQKGYKSGGYVGGETPALGGGMGKNAVHVNVENTVADKAEVGVEGNGTPGDPLRVIISAVKKDIARGGADAELRSRYQLSPSRRSR